MPTTPARTLRSNSSTPVSGNTAGGVSNRGRRRKDPRPIEINDKDDDDEEELLQTQLPLPTQEERDDEDDEDYEVDNEDDTDKYEDVKSTKNAASSNTRRTARKTISTHNLKDNRIADNNKNHNADGEDEEKEEEEEGAAPVVNIKPEVAETTEATNGSHETPTIDPNIAKDRIHQYYYDILDQEQHTILFDRSARMTSWPTLQVSFLQAKERFVSIYSNITFFSICNAYLPFLFLQHFWSSYPFNEYEYGHLYVRTRFCSLLIDSNAEPGYSKASLVAWESADWQEFMDDFRATKDACLNPNCSHIFRLDNSEGSVLLSSSISDSDRQERLMESQHRANSISFNQKYSIIEKTCQMNLLLSPIRQVIEDQILSGATGPPKCISETDVKRLYDAARTCDSIVVRKHLYRLFLPAEDTEPASMSNDDDDGDINDDEPPKDVLKSLEDLKEILRAKPWNLIWLQSRIDRLIWLWNDECFGVNVPHLEVIKYHDATRRDASNRSVSVGATKGSLDPKTPPTRNKGERADVLETLKRRRNALNKNHGDDPLIESRKLAATTKASTKATSDIVATKNILYQGKKSDIVVQFDDSDEEVMQDGDDEDEDGEDNDDRNASARRVRLP
jgi:hypothetical protein